MSPELDRVAAEAMDAADPLAAVPGSIRDSGPDPAVHGWEFSGTAATNRTRGPHLRGHRGLGSRPRSQLAQPMDDLPTYGGDLIARLVGARDGEVVMSDQTSVNLYKLASAAVTARPGATAIVTESTNFPSDLYVLRGIADAHGLDLRVVPSGIGGTTAADLELSPSTSPARGPTSRLDAPTST